jgi:hypothetical protein
MAYGQDDSYMRFLVVAVGVVAGTFVVREIANAPAIKAWRLGAKLPPGPKRDFFIGNFRNFPKQRWYEAFTRWKEEFGK